MPFEILITTVPPKKSKPVGTPEKTTRSKSSQAPSKKTAVKRRGATASASSSKRKASSEDEEAPPPRKRRLNQKCRVSDDDDESGDEVESEHIIESRFRDRSKLSQRDLALLKLKSKRQGLTPPESLESESESGESDESESERDSLFDGSSDDSDAESDFIVDDDGTVATSLPKEFSMDTFENPSHQFKKIFQFFVHIAVRPPVERKEFMIKMLKSEDYFSVPLDAARRRISSLRVTLVASSRWSPPFIELLEQYPNFEIRERSSVKLCDLCHIKSRQACKVVCLSGAPYERAGFQVDISKKRVTHKYHLGRFCAQRVKVFHQIAHWEYELFRVIQGEIDQLHERKGAKGIYNDRDEFVPVKDLSRMGKQPPEDLTDADAINDWFVERNIVEIEWKKIKAMTDSALNIESATKKGQTD